MAQFQGKRTDSGIPIHVQTERYTEGDSSDSLEGSVCMGEKPNDTVFPIQLDEDGCLKVTGIEGGSAGHEYKDGDSNFGAYGRLILGDDGSYLQTISVDTSGHLQVDVIDGGYDGIQYEDEAEVENPFGTVAFGHDGSKVYPVKVDSNGRLRVVALGYDGATEHPLSVDSSGRLQVEVVEGQYTGTQYTSGDSVALPVGTVALGHDGSEVRPLKVDNDGYLKVDIHDSPKATTLNTVTDVMLEAQTATPIVGPLSTRLSVVITSLATNTETIRIGDEYVGNLRGIELAPGESIEIETTDAVYGFNTALSVSEYVSVIWTEE